MVSQFQHCNFVLIQAAWALIDDFVSKSSIHGVRYLTEPKRHWTEKLWWAIAFAISVIAFGTLIHKSWKKWDDSPLVVSFSEKSTPVWQIPFPAVTVCPV